MPYYIIMPSHTGYLVRYGDKQLTDGFLYGIIVGSLVTISVYILIRKFTH